MVRAFYQCRTGNVLVTSAFISAPQRVDAPLCSYGVSPASPPLRPPPSVLARDPLTTPLRLKDVKEERLYRWLLLTDALRAWWDQSSLDLTHSFWTKLRNRQGGRRFWERPRRSVWRLLQKPADSAGKPAGGWPTVGRVTKHTTVAAAKGQHVLCFCDAIWG